jgi:hypothetical protein
MKGQFTKYTYEFLRDLARSYNVKDRRFFNTRELQEEVDLLEATLPSEVIKKAHAKAAAHVLHMRRLKKGVSQRMRDRGYDPNQARNRKRLHRRLAQEGSSPTAL